MRGNGVGFCSSVSLMITGPISRIGLSRPPTTRAPKFRTCFIPHMPHFLARAESITANWICLFLSACFLGRRAFFPWTYDRLPYAVCCTLVTVKAKTPDAEKAVDCYPTNRRGPNSNLGVLDYVVELVRSSLNVIRRCKA